MTLGWLAEVFLQQGPDAAARALDSLGSKRSRFEIQRRGQGRESVRTDVRVRDGIHYQSFDPPPAWEAPYCVNFVKFDDTEKTDYMYHGGEEFLVPTKGTVLYHFLWAMPRDGTSSRDAPIVKRVIGAPARRGHLVRINPNVPHHTWASGGPAEAWMVFRDLGGSAASISLLEL